MRIPLLLALAVTSCATTPTSVLVGSDLDNPPFAYVLEDGAPAGRDVEMMQALAERARLELVWERMPFDELLGAVEAGEVDLVCATLGVTPERAERVLFSEPYYATAISTVVRVGADEPHSIAELAGRRVSAGIGTTSARALALRAPTAVHVLENKAGLAADERLYAYELDAAVMDGPDALELAEASEGRLRLLDEHLASEDYALALPLTHRSLKRRLDEALRGMQRDGELAELDGRYGLAP